MAGFWKKKQFWGALVGIIFLGFCLKDIRLSEIEKLLERVNWYYLIPSLIASFVFLAMKGVRWRVLVSQQKKIPWVRALSLYSVGHLLSIMMPALTGQVGRVVLFARKEGFRKTFALSTVLLEVLFDAISLIVFMMLTSLAFAFPEKYRSVSIIVAAVTVGVMVLLYLVLHYQVNIEEMARKRLRERWPSFYVGTKKFVRSFTSGIELLRSSQHMAGTMGLSLLIWVLHMMVAWFLIQSFGLRLPLASAAVIMIINTIVLMVPIAPGNAGTFEFAVSLSLAQFFAVSRSDAVLFALALHLVDLAPVFICSYIFLHIDRTSLREIKTAHEEETILDRIDEEGAFIEEKEAMIKSFHYLPDEGVKVIDGIADFDRLMAVENSFLWVDMCKPTDEESFVLTHDFKFHPLAIEDVISERSNTKIDNYERYLFVVFNLVDFVGREEGLNISELDLFLTKRALVTVHYDDHRIFDYLYARVQRGDWGLSRGSDHLFHAVIDAVVDNYNTTMDIFEYEIDQIEEDVLGGYDKDTLRQMFALGRDVVQLKRIVRPQRELLSRLSRERYQLISPDLSAYFSDIHDHLIRVNELADTYREIVNSSLVVYYSSVSTKTNEIIKVLTLLTAIFIPPTFLVGLWGMNFIHMPELESDWGYPIALAVLLMIMLGMILFFRRKKWL